MPDEASVEWLPDGTARIVLPAIAAASPEEAMQKARDMIIRAAREAHISVESIDIESMLKVG